MAKDKLMWVGWDGQARCSSACISVSNPLKHTHLSIDVCTGGRQESLGKTLPWPSPQLPLCRRWKAGRSALAHLYFKTMV